MTGSVEDVEEVGLVADVGQDESDRLRLDTQTSLKTKQHNVMNLCFDFVKSRMMKSHSLPLVL